MAGATRVRAVVPLSQLSGALMAYAHVLEHTFAVPIGGGGIAFLTSFLFEWRSVKGQKIGMGAA